MAIWVNVNRAAKFPEVLRVYKRAGWGQGTGQSASGQPQNVGAPSSMPKGFLTYVKYLVQGAANGTIALPAWIRVEPGYEESKAWQTVQVNVSAIPGVRPLYTNGKYQNSSVYNP